MNLDELRNIKPKYSFTELEEFDDENSFMDAYVELLKQSITLLFLTVGERYCEGEEGLPKKISRDEAIVAGNLTRLIKLNTSFLENICNGKLEICYILSRCIAETAINTQYMLTEGEERVLRNYIKYSLITEKELWNTIQENVSEREDEKLHIEHRMQTSIKNSFEKSDFDFEDVNKSSKWKSIAKRAEAVAGDQFYKVFYGIASHSIHGNWQDILMNNLSKSSDGFEINLQWNRPRPQIMDGAIILNLLVANTFVEKEKLDNKEIYDEKFEMLREYLESIQSNHEEFLKK
nr:DUF5677 domain-containing protein [uncultured Allomuricauda sp.]